jgi:hypothetical protein
VGKPRGESYGKKLNCKGFAGDVIPFVFATNKDYLDAYRCHFLNIPELALPGRRQRAKLSVLDRALLDDGRRPYSARRSGPQGVPIPAAERASWKDQPIFENRERKCGLAGW